MSALVCLASAVVSALPARVSAQDEAPEPVTGAEVYARSCAVCHGKEGFGLEEARLAFPEDHRDCTRCHRPGNPAVMSLAQVETRQHDLFDVGAAPALRGDRGMVANASREALVAYLSMTMPRYRPGSLPSAEYEAVADFLLALNGR